MAKAHLILWFYSNGAKHYGIITNKFKYLKYVDKNGIVEGIDLFDEKMILTKPIACIMMPVIIMKLKFRISA